MIVVILKNTLLIILIILIIHFMIKNRIIDDIDSFRRIVVHNTTLNEEQHVSYNNDRNRPLISEEDKNSIPFEIKNPKNVTFDGQEYIPECPNSLTCDDYKKTTSKESGIEKDMKELYDFVYDNSEMNTNTTDTIGGSSDTIGGSSDTTLNTFFPENNKSSYEIKTDVTELDIHNNKILANIQKDENKNNCNFEVIGMIETNTDEDIHGLDSISSTHFSNI